MIVIAILRFVNIISRSFCNSPIYLGSRVSTDPILDLGNCSIQEISRRVKLELYKILKLLSRYYHTILKIGHLIVAMNFSYERSSEKFFKELLALYVRSRFKVELNNIYTELKLKFSLKFLVTIGSKKVCFCLRIN